MFNLPSIPDWDSLHPLVIHFPIALLIFAPLFIIIGLIYTKNQKCFFYASFVLMLFGTLWTFIAVSTGEAAGELALRSEEISEALENHEEFAEITRNYFSIMTLVYLIWLLVPKFTKKDMNYSIVLVANIVFLIAYLIGILFLISTGHAGGNLVHNLEVHALM